MPHDHNYCLNTYIVFASTSICQLAVSKMTAGMTRLKQASLCAPSISAWLPSRIPATWLGNNLGYALRVPKGVNLWPIVCWDFEFESRQGYRCLSLVIVLCCQIEVSASGWSLVQRIPTECGVSKWVWSGTLIRGGHESAQEEEKYSRYYLPCISKIRC
jgi:hypothetical protein